MRPEHIEKIIEVYKARSNEDKYSYVANLDEVRTNDYNLNIPRYVDTFEAEDTIDLATISQQLIELDKASHATDVTIAAFCKELGIEPPFLVQEISAV
jgi:type I restriction enzyme M protein